MQVLYQLSYGPKTELRHYAFVSSSEAYNVNAPGEHSLHLSPYGGKLALDLYLIGR